MLSPVRLDIDPIVESPFPLDLTLLKTHCKIDGSDLDDILAMYGIGAIEWAENETHRTIFSRAHKWVLRDFPQTTFQMIHLPRGKTQSVESIQYISNGSTVTLTGPSSGSPAGTDYQEDLRGDDGAILMPARGASWPSVDMDHPSPVTINFTAGWAADSVPKNLLHAIFFAVSDAVDLKGTSDLKGLGPALQAREALVSGYRMTRWY